MAVAGGMGDGGLAGVVSPKRALAIPLRRGPSDPELLARAVENSPSARATDDGVLLHVRRQQKPEQAGSDSPREGVFYLPANERNQYTRERTLQGPSWYGGGERIEGETLLRAPLVARGATGGKVAENAIDQMLDKGAAARVESDANEVAMSRWEWSGGSPERQLEMAREFLETWGGDPALAGHILATSNVGSRLRYALTENAAGNLARAEGFDSILGVSRSRAAPRITELFDIREATFPHRGDPYGTRLHEDFKGLLGRGDLR